MGSAIQSKSWRGARAVWLVGSRRQGRTRKSLVKDFLYGRTVVEVRDYLGEAEFHIRQTRNRRGAMRLSVTLWQNGQDEPHAVYSENEPEFNRIPFVGETDDRILQIEIE